MSICEKNQLLFSIDKKIKDVGFDLWGVTCIEDFEDFVKNVTKFYFENKFYATMEWLAKNLDVKFDPTKRFTQAKSIIVVAKDYYQPTLKLPIANGNATNYQTISNCGLISNYAIGEDYHKIMEGKLEYLAEFLLANGAKLAKIYVDTGPVFEKYWAYKCGIGWIGKNSLIINRKYGSFLFLGVIITDLVIDVKSSQRNNHNSLFPFYKSYCGTCVKCIKECPTGAIVADGVIDSNKCIAYLTIEHKGIISRELREKIGGWIFGCDICQVVCPWNVKKANSQYALNNKSPNPDNWFLKKEIFNKMDLLTVLNMSENEFKEVFKNSPVKRARYEGLIRNTIIALANLRVKESAEYIRKFVNSKDYVLRATSIWALAKLSAVRKEDLECLLEIEQHKEVIDEIKWALSNVDL